MGKRKLAHLTDSDEDGPPPVQPPNEQQEEEEEEEEEAMEAKPVGDFFKKTGRGRSQKLHYHAFQLEGNTYQLEDAVLVTPEEKNQKPYVAIIKEINQSTDGSIAVIGQWFYRPEEAEKKGGGNFVGSDARELFYSFHMDKVAAESVMHKCVVHFIPYNKQSPQRSKHPGFVVRQVYDAAEKKLWRLSDRDYEDSKQKEIDLLISKTHKVLGDLPDIEPVEMAHIDQGEGEKNKRSIRRNMVSPLSILKDDNTVLNEGKEGKLDTPGSALSTDPQGGFSEAYTILQTWNALTGLRARDRWLEKVLLSVKHVCTVEKQNEKVGTVGKDALANGNKLMSSEEDVQGKRVKVAQTGSSSVECQVSEVAKVNEDLHWPEVAIGPVTLLERIAYETLGTDMHKYNIKIRQLEFNLKNGAILARRFLKAELEPSKVLVMSPAELKEGFSAEEKSAQEPEELETMQMADVRCTICGEKKVGVKDIIHVGYGDRYQLQCLKCGNSWYSSRDSISALTTESVNRRLTVGAAPWATSKFEEVEKELTVATPCEIGKQGYSAAQRTGATCP